MLKRVPLRHLLLLAVLVGTIIVASIFRRLGLGELALLVGFVVLAFLVEAGVYVARRFFRGLHGRE